MSQNDHGIYMFYFSLKAHTGELLEHSWNHENMFETRVV